MFSLKAALLVFVAVHEQRVALVVYTWDLLLSDWCTLMLCLLHLLTFCTYVHWFEFVLVSNYVLHLRVLAGFGVFGANSTGVWRRTRIIDCRLCQIQVLAAHVPELLFKMHLCLVEDPVVVRQLLWMTPPLTGANVKVFSPALGSDI